MRRRSVTGTVTALLLILAAAGGGYWFLLKPSQDSDVPGPQAAESPSGLQTVFVEATPVLTGTVIRDVTAVGSLRSNEAVMISPEIAGRIAEIHFREGERVESGARLVTLDDSIYRAELAQAQARLELNRRNAERAAELFQRQVGTARTRDEAQTALRTAEAEVALARARLEKTRITAPFPGVLGLRRVSVGDYVVPGQELVNLENIDPIKVDFRVPESALRLLREGQTVSVQVDAFPGESFEGEVYAIDPQVDIQGRSVAVRARLPNPDRRLKPGLFARVSLIIERREDAMLIPEQAVVPTEKGAVVFTIVGGKAVETQVQLGRRRDGKVEVLSGLAPGDIVISAGQMKVRNGTPVTIQPPAGV